MENDRVKELEAEVEHLQHLNDDLKRINRERSNADRKLVPKRTHTGYVFLRETEMSWKHKSGTILQGYRETFQTPYTYLHTRDQVKDLAAEEMPAFLEKCGMPDCRFIMGDLDKLQDLVFDPAGKWAARSNAAKVEATLNGKDLYWEISFFASKPIQVIPEIMNEKLYEKTMQAAAAKE